MTSKQTPKPQPLKIQDFDIKNFGYIVPNPGKPEDEKNKPHHVGFSKYNYPNKPNSQFAFATDWLITDAFTIPTYHEQYYPTDDKRQFMKIQLDDSNKACRELSKMVNEIDAFTEKYMINNIIPAPSMKFYDYNLTPTIKEPKEVIPIAGVEVKLDKNGQPFKKYDSMKMKFSINYATKKIDTIIFIRKPNPNDPTKFIREHANVTTIDEIHALIPKGSKVRMVATIQKFWAEKTPKAAPRKRGDKPEGVAGLAYKIIQLEVEPSENTEGQSLKEQFKVYAFEEDEEIKNEENNQSDVEEENGDDNKTKKNDLDDSEDSPKVTKKTKNDSKKVVAKDASDDSKESGSGSESGSESEPEEPEEPPKKAAKGKPKTSRK